MNPLKSNARTLGVKPAVVATVILTVVAYLVTQTLVDFSPVVELVLQCLLVGGGAAGVGPGLVKLNSEGSR